MVSVGERVIAAAYPWVELPEITVLSSSTGLARPNPGESRPPPPPVFHCNEQFGRKRRSDRLKWRLVTRLLGSGPVALQAATRAGTRKRAAAPRPNRLGSQCSKGTGLRERVVVGGMALRKRGGP